MTKPELQASERAKRAAEAISIGLTDQSFRRQIVQNTAEVIETTCHLRELEAVVEALKPFTHPDLAAVLSHNVQGDDSPVFGRNHALLTIGDFKRAIAALKSLDAAKERK